MQLHILICPRLTTRGRMTAARDYYMRVDADRIEDVNVDSLFRTLIHNWQYHYSCGKKVYTPDPYVQTAYDELDYLIVEQGEM